MAPVKEVMVHRRASITIVFEPKRDVYYFRPVIVAGKCGICAGEDVDDLICAVRYVTCSC